MSATVRERSPSPQYSETVAKKRKIDSLLEKGTELLQGGSQSGDSIIHMMMMQNSQREARSEELRRVDREREDRREERRERDTQEREERREREDREREERREDRKREERIRDKEARQERENRREERERERGKARKIGERKNGVHGEELKKDESFTYNELSYYRNTDYFDVQNTVFLISVRKRLLFRINKELGVPIQIIPYLTYACRTNPIIVKLMCDNQKSSPILLIMCKL